MTAGSRDVQISLFESANGSGHLRLEAATWPPAQRFPLNVQGRRVRDQVLADLGAAARPLIVAGYASLDYLIECAADLASTERPLRLLFGSEPYEGQRDSYASPTASFTDEMERYWLERNVSLRLSARIVETMDHVRSGRIEARILGGRQVRLHAKIFAGDAGITVGSSNFTRAGLARQFEANVRLTPKEKVHFAEARSIAENLWQAGEDYGAGLLELLERLLRVVGWREALARASAELLDGEWARDYLQAQAFLGDLPLWPSQEHGIADALWVLENVGSVLIADATGSGKTRLGAHLMRAVVDRIWRHGRARRASAVVVTPPAVRRRWREAAREAGVPLDIESHGQLSHVSSDTHDDVTDAVRRAQVLAVDEAHNFLNPASRRTRAILGNMADHAILFTATPINRSTVDLLRLADMLGADNLADSTLDAFAGLLRRRKLDRTLTSAELETLKHELERFTVRRTKTVLNAMVDAAPERYRDAAGRMCRYPEHRARTYALHESPADRDLARSIREAAEGLHGAALLAGVLEMPDVLRRENWTEEKYLAGRIRTASRLSSYLIMATLRSSSAALLEHVAGTEAALTRFGLPPDAKRQSTGNVLGKLESIRGRPPESRLRVPLPAWLSDPAEHDRACAHDQAIYRRILALAAEMSERREIAKASLLRKLARRHGMVVAFDSRPMTLALLRRHLAALDPGLEVLLATGERRSGRRAVEQTLQLGAERRRLVALCSDSMSEGVNLQAAAAVVHLDMPSVVRIAEQRVGRVDRMDSPHATIHAWWPQDAPELALRSDERFIERFETVEALLGSNLPLPDTMLGRTAGPVVTAHQAIEEFAQSQKREPWDGLRDVFAPVRDLVSGNDALVPREVYENYRGVSARVLSRVSVVGSHEPWALVCFVGSMVGAPRWVLVRATGQPLVTDLPAITKLLRERLGPHTADLPLSEGAMGWLEAVLRIIKQNELELLPRRKVRAIAEMRIVLRSYATPEHCTPDQEARLAGLLEVLDRHREADHWYDWDAVAEAWLDLVRPVWYERLATRKRTRPLLLKDIRRDLLGPRRMPLSVLLDPFERMPTLRPIDERVAACILGIPGA